MAAAAGAAAAAAAGRRLAEARRRLRAVRREAENCFCTFALEQSGHLGVSPLRTSSSKCDSHFMHTYS